MRDEHRRDRAVVVDEVALRDRPRRPARRACRGSRASDRARPSPGGSFPPHVARRLVVAEPLERRRAQVAVVRPLGELDLATSLGSTQTTSPFRTFGIFGTTGERRLVSRRAARAARAARRSSRSLKPVPTFPTQPYSLPARTPSTSAPNAPAAPALALRPAADHELLPAVRLDLQPVAAAACPPSSATTAFLAITPSSPCSFAASSSASPSSKTPESWTTGFGASSCSSRARRSVSGRSTDRLAVDLEHVEDLVREPRARPAASPRSSPGRSSSSAHDLAVDDRVGRAQRLHAAPSRRARTARVRSLPRRETSFASPPRT